MRPRIAVLMASGLLALRSFAEAAEPPAATLTFFVGQVSVKGPGLAPPAPAKLNQALKKGDTVHTGAESRAEIALPDNRGVLRVAENSRLALDELASAGSEKSAAQLNLGRVWMNIRKAADQKNEFQVQSPVAAAAVRGTVYRMDVAADSSALVRVYAGQVQVGWLPYQTYVPGQVLQAPTEVTGPQPISQAQWIELLSAGQQVRLGRDRQAEVSRFDTQQDARDEWVRWNQERDAQQ